MSSFDKVINRRVLLQMIGATTLALSVRGYHTSSLSAAPVLQNSEITKRVVTGFDLEILVAKDLLEKLIEAAYDEGLIPSEITTEGSLSLKLSRPANVEIPHTDNPNGVDTAIVEVIVPNIELTATFFDQNISIDLPPDVTIGWAVTIVTDENNKSVVVIHYRYLHWPPELKDRLKDKLGDTLSEEDLNTILLAVKGAVDAILSDKLQLEILEVPDIIYQPNIRRLNGGDGFQSAIGIYFNLPLQITEEEKVDHPRGDILRAKTFLPQNRSFAVGSGPLTPQFIAQHIWQTDPLFTTRVKLPNQTLSLHPMRDGDNIVGRHIAFTAVLMPGGIRVIYKGVYTDTPFFVPEADVTVNAFLFPYVENGELKINTFTGEPDIDTGAVGDVLAFVGGLMLGGLVGSFLGLGSTLGGPIGVGSVISLNVGENIIEEQSGETLQKEAIGFTDLLTAMPKRLQYFPATNVEITNKFDDVAADIHGIVITGHTILLKPEITISRDSIDFTCIWPRQTATEVVVISNSGEMNLSVSVLPTDENFFIVAGMDRIIRPGEEIAIQIVFQPDFDGTFNSTLRINTNDPQNSHILIPLNGETFLYSRPDSCL